MAPTLDGGRRSRRTRGCWTAYRGELLRWNRQINLLSRRDAGSDRRHADPPVRRRRSSCGGALRARRSAGAGGALRVFDLGSGGGLPAFVWLALAGERGRRAATADPGRAAGEAGLVPGAAGAAARGAGRTRCWRRAGGAAGPAAARGSGAGATAHLVHAQGLAAVGSRRFWAAWRAGGGPAGLPRACRWRWCASRPDRGSSRPTELARELEHSAPRRAILRRGGWVFAAVGAPPAGAGRGSGQRPAASAGLLVSRQAGWLEPGPGAEPPRARRWARRSRAHCSTWNIPRSGALTGHRARAGGRPRRAAATASPPGPPAHSTPMFHVEHSRRTTREQLPARLDAPPRAPVDCRFLIRTSSPTGKAGCPP